MRWTSLALGVLLGVLLLGGLRFALAEPPAAVHHHANWALFVDGERVDFSGDRYMEDVASCAADPAAVRPRDRIHLHDNNMDVVHVHHAGATWGHLFANLGWGLGDGWMVADDGRRWFASEGDTLVFVVNGMQMPDLHERVVRSTDRVLVSVGSDAATALSEQFPQVASDAAEYNERSDPAGCAGAHGPMTLGDRLRHAFLE